MKNNLTRKLWSFILISLLFTSSLMVAVPGLVKATNTNAWQEITPRRTTTTPALGDNDYQYLGQPGNGAKYTSFADLMETKPDGSKVFHYFVAIPMAYPWSGFVQAGSIYHSSDQGKTWNKINPNWGSEGGSLRTSLKAINQAWTDGNGSQWNKKLFLLTNNSSNFGPGWGYYYQNYRPSLFRYEGNGSNSSWTEIYSDYSGQYTVATPYYINSWTYGYGSRMFMEEMNGQLFFVNYYKTGTYWWDAGFNIRIFRSNTTTLAQLVNNATITWSVDTSIPITYSTQYYIGAPVAYAFKKAGNYLYLSTCMNNNPSQNVESSNGLFFRSNVNGIGGWTLLTGPGSPTGYMANPISLNQSARTFRMRIPNSSGTNYLVHYDNNGIVNWYGYDYSLSWAAYLIQYMSYGTVGYTETSRNDTTHELWISKIVYPFSAGSPAPLSLEFYKGCLYAGFGNSSAVKLRRTNNFTNMNFGSWDNCGAITATDDTNVNRQQSYAVTTLGKTAFKDNTGMMQDANLYIGGAQGNSLYSTGFGALFFTQGFDSTGADAVPLKYQILEDEWRYTKTSPINGTSYRNQIYDFYDVYPGSLGLIVQFCASNNRAQADGFGGQWNQRKVHIYNAPPTCDVKVNPEPVINERGTDADVNFQFIPIGGYGPGNVKITLETPANIYLPTKDSDNQPINQQFNKAIAMNGGTLNVTAKIRSTPAATVKKYLLKVTIEDLVLGIKVERYFEFIIVYPKPGFSVNVSPSMFDLYQGDCPVNQCCSDSCKMVNVDLISRNDFEDNVIAGIVWINQPPSQDVALKWKQSTFIYDYIDDKTIEGITRKNIGTRYQLQVNVTPYTTVGTWKFKIFFISGLLKRSQTVTFTVAPARPGIKITSNPSVIRVVPGGVASYRIMIESTNGFVGKVNLTLQNLPPNVTVVTYKAENPPVGYSDNYVEISPGHPAYANLVVQTYSLITTPSAPKSITVVQYSEKLVYISWEYSTKGSYPIAGYEVWRGTSQYVDKATRLGIVGSEENSFNDNSFVSNRTYFYFIRAFDDQNPPNYSSYTSSGEVKTASISNSFATISNEGTLPGFTNIDIVGQGVGFGPDDQAVAPVGHGVSVLHVYEQVQDMATPAFTWLGAFFLLISMIAVFIFMMEKKAKKVN